MLVINTAEQLLERTRADSASCFVHLPFLYNRQTEILPDGAPQISPMMQAGTKHSGRANKSDINFVALDLGSFFRIMSVTKLARHMYINSEGTTEYKQSFIAFPM